MREPLPAHKRAEILVRVAAHSGAGTKRSRRSSPPRRPSRSRPRGSRRRGRVDVHVRRGRGAQAGRRDDPDGRRAGAARESSPSRCGCRSASSARSARSTSRSTSSRTRSRPRSRPAARSCSSPRRQTPLSALSARRARARNAASRPGWLNVVVGPAAELGNALVDHDRVALITFTGSPEVGWGIKARAPRKKVGLELGQQRPVIVEPDARPRPRPRQGRRAPSGSPARRASRSSASTSQRESYDDFVQTASCRASRRSSSAIPLDDDTDVGPRDQRRRARPRARLDRRGARARPDRAGRRAPTAC